MFNNPYARYNAHTTTSIEEDRLNILKEHLDNLRLGCNELGTILNPKETCENKLFLKKKKLSNGMRLEMLVMYKEYQTFGIRFDGTYGNVTTRKEITEIVLSVLDKNGCVCRKRLNYVV